MLTPVGSKVSSIGEGVPLVSGGQDLLGDPHALDKRRLPGLQGCQSPFEVGLSFIGYPIEVLRHQPGGHSFPR